MIHTLGNCAAIKTALGPRQFIQIERSIERANKVNTLSSPNSVAVEPSSLGYIEELVVCLPETRTWSALKSLRRNITNHTNILLVQDLPGVAERLRDFRQRPSITFGVQREKLYVSGSSSLLEKLSPEYSIQYPAKDLQLLQLENLVVDSCIYSLSRVLGCLPSALPSELMYNLIAESCAILASRNEELINPGRMLALAKERAKTATLRPEHMHIKHYWYLNGQLQRLAKDYGVRAVYNPMVMDLVKAKGLAR